MKIDSKKLMIVLLALTALVLIALLIYGGFALGDRGEGSEGSETHTQNRQHTSPPDTTNGGSISGDSSESSGETSDHPGTASPTGTPVYANYPARSGRLARTDNSLLSLVIDWETTSRTADSATVKLTVRGGEELLADGMRPAEEPWLYLRSIGGVCEGGLKKL